MKRKKLLSTAVAGALVAAQVVMPVMAEESGGFDVTVDTKTGVLRVQVPTSLAIAVDQFEIGNAGNQIYAETFNMTNKSEMDVKVTVKSTATLGSGVTLVSTAGEAKTSEAGAWLGVAAMTADNSYDDATTTDKTETIADMTDASPNVTTFATDSKAAEQTFYLAKGTGDATYVSAVASDSDYKKETFAKYYELTALATQPTSNDELQDAVDDSDVYEIATSNAGKTGQTVKKYEKGSTVPASSFAGANTYYTASSTAAEPSGSSVFVTAAMATDGGKAGFTYVGKLSEKKETWTSTDISKVAIAYTIAGVTGSRYDEVENDCTYGLYASKEAKIAVTSGTADNAPVVLTFTALKGEKLANDYFAVNGEVLSDWPSFGDDVTIDVDAGTVTVNCFQFGYPADENHEYTFEVKDTDGKVYSTGMVTLAP